MNVSGMPAAMTIGEQLRQQVLLINRVKWALVAVVIGIVFYHVFRDRPQVAMYEWIAVWCIPWLVATIVLAKRLKCPRCQHALGSTLAGKVSYGFAVFRDAKRQLLDQDALAVDACPYCGLSFDEPMPPIQ